MTGFEYFFGFFGLLLGLTVAEVASKLANAIDSHAERPIGLLTSMLAAFVILDIASFWIWTWPMREIIDVTWGSVLLALIVALSYFLSASLIFPRTPDWPSYDVHYWARKRYVLTGIIFANIFLVGVPLTFRSPQWNDVWLFVMMGIYWIPLIALWFSRSRRVDLVLLTVLILQFVLDATNILPDSQWVNDI